MHLTTATRRDVHLRHRVGFTSVMMDGSLLDDGKTPADFDYNVRSPPRW